MKCATADVSSTHFTVTIFPLFLKVPFNLILSTELILSNHLLCARFQKAKCFVLIIIHLEKEMATQSSVPAWRIPRTEEPGGLQPMELPRVRHCWSNLVCVIHQIRWQGHGKCSSWWDLSWETLSDLPGPLSCYRQNHCLDLDLIATKHRNELAESTYAQTLFKPMILSLRKIFTWI